VAQPADALSAAVDSVLNRAAATAAGTYVVSAGAIESSREPFPIVVQPDFLRGPEQAIRMPVALGATVAQAAMIRMRLVAAAEGSLIGDVSRPAAAGRVHVVDEFKVSPGQFDLYAAIGHARAEGGFIVALSKTTVTVPDLWQGGLVVTPIVLGETAAAASSGMSGPFTFGPTALTPASSNYFARSDSLNIAFRVYNWTTRAGESPDLTVEYVFHEITSGRAVFFNKTRPQRLTSATLEGAFDPAGGVVSPGMAIGLQPFTFGPFQLTVRVTDNRTQKTVSQQATFVVSPQSAGPRH
jgi:hypothetical protein